MKKLKHNKEFKNVLSKLNLDNDISNKVLQYFKENPNLIEKLAFKSYLGEIPNFDICKRKPFIRLVTICYKLIEVKEYYLKMNLPEEIFINTIEDIKLRQEIYKETTDTIGLSIDDVIWFRHIFNNVIFKIGALQFQIFNMIYLDKETLGEDYMTFFHSQKRLLPPNTPVVNVHIQKGANLSPNYIYESFKLAEDFFSKYYPNKKFKAFICYSWLLYSGNINLLDSNSNILKFASNFEIISEVKDNEEALARIFGIKNNKDSHYTKTSLQKAALSSPNSLGFACGVRYIY